MSTKKNICKKKDHENWSRRSFMKSLGLASLSTPIMAAGVPLSFVNPSPLMQALNESESEKTLLIIRLQGGNDGLNTIVPIYDYDLYAQLRPTLRHKESKITKLNSDFGIPNFMNPLRHLWENGGMKVVNGTGYDEQNLSHFRGTDIWSTGNSKEKIESGIFGRLLESQHPDYITNLPNVPPAIQIGGIGDKIFNGEETNYAFTIANAKLLEQIATKGSMYNVLDVPKSRFGDQLSFLRGVQNTTSKYASLIRDVTVNETNKVEFPKTDLGRAMAIISKTIKGNLGTKIFMVTLNGFDTHVKQKEKHEQLLTNLTNSISSLYKDLEFKGKEKDVITMTFSEFGRRAKENGSKGTDHGSAAPMLLFGNGLNENGFIGEHPNMRDLDKNGNLKHSQNYIDIYGTILKDWLCVDNNTIIKSLGQNFTPVNLGFNCESTTLSSDDNSNKLNFEHNVIYDNQNIYLVIKNRIYEKHKIEIYNILGEKVSDFFDDFLAPGINKINIKRKAPMLSSGIYIYNIKTQNRSYSKKFIIN